MYAIWLGASLRNVKKQNTGNQNQEISRKVAEETT